MGLTRPRAYQIFDIDYKQAVRVVQTSNVTLAGGAPAIVDGVSLSQNDRVLVTGQSTASQNGLYYVTTVGTGSNGTWARSIDGNETGEIQAGLIVMVTQGTSYADTQWKLTTDDPIVVGTTPLTFVLNVGSIVGGLTTQVQFNDGGVLGATAGLTFDKTSNALTATGNITGSYFIGNGSQLTGLPAGYANANVVAYGESGWAGNLIPSANVTYSLGNTNNRWKDLWISNSTIYLGNVEISANATSMLVNNNAVLTSGTPLSTSGNITAGNISVGTGNIDAGNINTVSSTANYMYLNTAGSGIGLNTGGMEWYPSEGTFNLQVTDGIPGLVHQQLYYYVQAAANITAGQAVQFAGVVGNIALGAPANAASPSFLSAYTIGIASEDIPVGEKGHVTYFGKVFDLDTSSYNVGDVLYLSSNVAGGFTTTQPPAPNVRTILGVVTRKDSTQGIITTRLIDYPRLQAGLRDVANVNPTANQYLRFNSAGTYWEGTDLDISNDTSPTLGGALDANGYAISNAGNITGSNLITGGNITATGNISGGNISATGALSTGAAFTAPSVTATGNISGNNINANLVAISTTANRSVTTGQIAWNSNDATFNMGMSNGVTLQVGQEQYYYVHANTNISNGQVLSFVGVVDGMILVDPADASAPGFNPETVIGIATQNITAGDMGYATSFGKIRDLNTNAFNVGDVLYLDPATPGGLTNVLPTAPDPKVELAAVVVKSVTVGIIQVRVNAFPRLENLQDVTAAAATDHDYLVFNGTANVWQHQALEIFDDKAPELGGNLNANNFSISNVNSFSGANATFTGGVYADGSITALNQLATKAYVDTQVSTGLHIHEAVTVEAGSPLNATYTAGGTTPTITAITGNTTLTSVGSNLSVDDMVIPYATTNGLTSGQPYFVVGTPTADTFNLSTVYGGTALANLTNGTGLSIPTAANPGVGAKLTNAGTQAALTIDGVNLALNNRVLVYQQANAAHNGVYFVSNVGNVSTNWVLTRSLDADNYGPQDPNAIGGGDYFFVTSGATGAGESYVISNTGVIVLGTTPITFTLFSAAPTYTGTSPIVVSGQTISLANTTGTGDFVVLQNSPTLNSPNIGAATGTSVNVTGNVTGGNLTTAGRVDATGNITGGNLSGTNIVGTTFSGTSITVSANVDGGNVVSQNLLTAVGNISTSANIIVTGNAVLGGNITTTPGTNANLLIDPDGTGFLDITATTPVVIANSVVPNSTSALRLTGSPSATASNVGLIHVGTNLPFSDTNILSVLSGSANSYVQMILQNQSTGTAASADYIVNNDTTSGATVYGDFGINSTTFGTAGPFGYPNGTYLYAAGGNLSVGTNGANSLVFATNNTVRGSFDSAGALNITGNITGGNLSAGSGIISTTGNINGGNINGLVSTNTRTRTLNFIIDGGGTVITTGSKGYAVVDINATILAWTILLDQTGNANVDVKRSTYASFPTTASIAGTIPPTVTSNTKAQNTTLSGWGNTTIVSGDILEFVVQGTPAAATRVTVSLELIATS